MNTLDKLDINSHDLKASFFAINTRTQTHQTIEMHAIRCYFFVAVSFHSLKIDFET